MKHTVDRPSNTDAGRNVPVETRPAIAGMAERQNDTTDQQRAHHAAHEDHLADRIVLQDLLHQHVVDGVRGHAAADRQDAALIGRQRRHGKSPRDQAMAGADGDQPPVTLMWRRQRRALVAAVDDEVVALRLARDRVVDRGIEQVVALRGAQRRAQVGGVLLAEAHVERAGAGEAHAVAGFAEIVRQRRDEAEPAAGLGDAHIAGRAAGAVVDVLQRVALGKPRAHHRERQVLVEPALRRCRRAASPR